MDDVSQKYLALLEAAKELLAQHAYEVNGVSVDAETRRRNRIAFQEASERFMSCVDQPVEVEHPGLNGSLGAHVVAG